MDDYLQLNTVECAAPPPQASELTDDIRVLSPGQHLCWFYERDPVEQIPALVPFIQTGLAQNEQIIYIADDQTVYQMAACLEQSAIDVAHETTRGRLKLWTKDAWRQPGKLDSGKKAHQVQQLIESACDEGFDGIRFGLEMTWTLGSDVTAGKLENWEASINMLLGSSFPSRMICQYNCSRLSADLLLAALHTHPHLILGDCLYENSFYQAPLILNEAEHPSDVNRGKATQVQWMLQQLKRTKVAQNEREQLIAKKATDEFSEERRAHLAAIVEYSDDAILTKDLQGVITSWNRAAERMFGYKGEEIIGKPISTLIPPERFDEEPGILERIRRGDRIDHYETVRRRKDGTLLDISLTISPLKDSHGRIFGASKIARDITERKRAEEALRSTKELLARANERLETQVQERTASLRQAIAQMEEFSYTVSHDLRGPVRAMQGYAKAIEEDFGTNLPPEAREYLQRIIRGGARMDRLIRDLLTYSRLSRRDIQLEPVSLDQLVYDVLEQFPQMQPPQAQVSVVSPLGSVLAHGPSLGQALTNLLTNAVKFVPPGTTPQVRVRTEGFGGRLRLWVEDNGIGIKPEYQHRIFGTFERLHPENHYEGTGIGLAIVRKAVDRMGGSVGLESDGITGSRFWIELPVVEED